MAQGVLAFQYAAEKNSSGVTGYSGLGVYLDLIKASGLGSAVRRHVKVAGSRGWLDIQMIVALLALNLCGGEPLPFPSEVFAGKGRHKLFGLVTNRTDPGDEVIRWLRERCGKSEEAHAMMKHDLAGGTLPSGRFGANGAESGCQRI